MKDESYKNQHIIFLGFAKCGTTFINYILKQTKEFLAPTNIKEIGYFLPKNFTGNLEDYLKYYKKHKKYKKTKTILVESCPPYLHAQELSAVFSNIKKSNLDCKFVVCIRHPVYRAYSRYIHGIYKLYKKLINKNFADGELTNKQFQNFVHKRNYKYSFWEAIEVKKDIYQPSYYDRVKELIEEFGRDKVLLFIMEKDIDLFDDFYQRLCEFCAVDYQPYFKNKTMPLVSGGRYLPKYYYADSKDLILECNQTLFKLPEGDLLLSQTKKSRIFKNMPRQLALEVTASANFWTEKLTKEMCLKNYQKYFEKDMMNFIKLIQDYYGYTYDLNIYQDYTFKDKSVGFSQLDYELLKSNLEILA